VTRLGADVIGRDSVAVEPARPFCKLNHEPAIPEEILPVMPEYLNGRAYTIFGGSSEVQRDMTELRHRLLPLGDFAGGRCIA
jgi:acyl-CoA dehydrogenase